MRETRDPFRRLSAREVPDKARWSNSGRKMDEGAARTAARRAEEQRLARAAAKDKGRR